MADNSSGGSGWTAFLAGIILVAIIAVGVVAYTGGFNPQQRTAQIDVNMPDVKINPPDVHLPSAPPAPVTPPSAPANTN
jgi:amino acid transporter